MKKRKYVYGDFAFFDRTGIARYLEKMAGKGWMIRRVNCNPWVFERTEPRKLRFSISYFPEGARNGVPEQERKDTFREFCGHAGWTLAAERDTMMIWYSDREDPLPIATDPVLELETIHSGVKKQDLTVKYTSVVGGILFLGLLIFGLCMGKRSFLSSSVIWLILFNLVKALWDGFELVQYYRWRKKARDAALVGEEPPETRSYPLVSRCLLLGMLVLFGYYLAGVGGFPVGLALGVVALAVSLPLALNVLTYNSGEADGEGKWRAYGQLILILLVVLVAAVLFAAVMAGILTNGTRA